MQKKHIVLLIKITAKEQKELTLTKKKQPSAIVSVKTFQQ